LSTVMQSFAIFCVIAVLWVAYVTAAHLLPSRGQLSGAIHWLARQDVHGRRRSDNGCCSHVQQGSIYPDFVFCMFQLTFAAITVALITGALPSASSSRR